jgi:protein-ribulosamine 3-kinase
MLPPVLQEPIRQALAAMGDTAAVVEARPVGGGCINHGMRLTTHVGHYFLKWNNNDLPGMFEAEVLGLKLLRETHTVRVPQVLAVGALEEDHPAYLLMEWLDADKPKSAVDMQYLLGQQVAMMHRYPPGVSEYGLERSNYIGSNVQVNNWRPNWITFFGEQRLGFQCRLAEKNGLMPAGRRKKLERLIERLDELLDAKLVRRPSLLHGDLWGGNIIPAPGGLALIDPAVYYGDREAELAFTELFGGFTAAFYRGYQETFALDDGYARRKDLYNLYHLLNHLNLFGESYGMQVDEVLRRYAS